MKSKFLGFNAKMALAALAVCGMFTSCYEKEEIDTPVLADPIYVITGNLISAATGEPVDGTVTIKGESVNESVTVTNGAFSKTTGLTGGKSYTIVADIEGYLKAARTVYLAVVDKGQTSSANVDFYLYDASSLQGVTPELDALATPEEAKKAKEAVEKSVKSAFENIPGVDPSKITVVVDAEGNTKVTTPVVLDKSTEPVNVAYYAMGGFASTVTLTDTKALTAGEIWLASAEKVLNKKYGITLIERSTTLSALTGYSIAGYKMVYTMINRALSFNSKGGVVTYQDGLVIIPVYESHDGHDTHDGHGFNPGAGGGSSASGK